MSDGSRASKLRKGELDGPWIAHEDAMRRSFAFRALTFNDLRVLFRLEEEHMAHAGSENGNLQVSYPQFRDYGLPNDEAISLAIKRLEALGFVDVKRAGYDSSRGQRAPNRYRLTYVVGRHRVDHGNIVPAPVRTHDWDKLRSSEAVTKALAKIGPQRRHRKKKDAGAPCEAALRVAPEPQARRIG
ncbi:hypothetical protein DLJ53_19150 [Acuticoccus sediminis]|uniref:Helix-turn-helix domain-containing protein n=1 Tax=Acuticoccus sediminis TaxID=2184697 RepID=A0A8B2NRX4_9HYPH|nr:hypothetical protein [Acuticoccus sediminis]RAH99863.1 hypothetical protein DLJ53_19150 [Acuticoccus sediminis]